jgi:transcriptional regulator with XRE-family HTH domain
MNNLKKIRALRNLTQYELARQTGLSQTRIWLIEKEYRPPSPEIEDRLAACMRVDPKDIFSDSEEDLKARYERLYNEQQELMREEVARKTRAMKDRRGY